MNCLPDHGIFVSFMPDFVASVAHFENEELTFACRQLQAEQKRYVAFVECVSRHSTLLSFFVDMLY